MNEYRKRDTGEVITEAAFRAAFDNISFPDVLTKAEFDTYRIDPVMQAPQPTATRFQSVLRNGVTGDGRGNWFQSWTVVDWPQAQIDSAINEARVAKNIQINEWRAKANMSTFTHQGKVFACDALSRSDIDGVANNISLTGSFPVGFPNAWKAVDNSYLPIPDIAAFKAFYSSMTLQGALNFKRAQDLKTALAAATTIEDIEAITW